MDYGYSAGGGGGGYTTTNYGAQGGADGGGFLGGSQAGSQDTPGGTKRYGQDSLRPVTIRQLLNAVFPYPDAEAKIDDVALTQADFVGQVREVSSQATNTTYKIDDGTGTIDVKQWIDSDRPPETQKYMPKEGDYVHVWGKLKEFNNRRHVGSHVIHPVTDYNEISYHLLHATAVHLYFVRGPPGQANGAAGAKTEGQGVFVDGGYGGAANGAAAGGAPVGKKLPPRLSATAKRVYEFLQTSPQSNEGLHVHTTSANLGLPVNDVFKAGDELLSEGLIYTTVDDETWAVLEF